MSEMIERIARALFLRDVEEDVCDGTWEENAALHERILADARAAMAALRSPSLEMLLAGQVVNILPEPRNPPNAFEFLSREEVEVTWQAMIDAALKDQ